MSPTSRAALLAAMVAALGPFVSTEVVVLAAIVLAGLVIGDALSVRRPPMVERSVPHTLSRGVAAPFEARITGPHRGRVWLRQAMPPGMTIDPDRGDGTLDATVVGRRRGRHVLPAIATRTTGTLGLARWDHVVGDELEVAVYPDLPAARAVVVATRYGLARDLAQLTRGALGLGTELERVRDYLPDDDLRQVNWRATARVGRPMSNEFRLDEDRDVICVVDAGRLMAAPTGPDRTRLDVALDAVASVALVADEVGDRCGAVAFDDEVTRRVRPRRRGGRVAIDILFDLHASPVDSNHLAAFHAVGGGKRACVIVFTDIVDEAAAQTLVEAMPVLVRRHAVIVASVVDDDLSELVRRAPTGVIDVYAATVAVDVLDARARAVARLRRAGADVVEAPAHSLGRASVAHYLTMKSRAVL